MKLEIEMRTSQYNDESEDDDDSSSLSDFLSYRDRPEWADVEPKSIKTQTSVMNIKYTPRYEETFSYFRAMLARDELSERSLALTADCLELQRSNFSVWYFRRRILKKLKHHLKDELAFVGQAIEEEPKNYQVWHHRKTIVEWLRDGSNEKQLIASVLVDDNKNYHAWQHRQWVIKEFDLWDGEIDYTDIQLTIDPRNNSAWNHRFFVVKSTRLFENLEWIEQEIKRVHESIDRLPNNESTWSYLRGILMLTFGCISSHAATGGFCDRLCTERGCQSIHLLGFILDVTLEKINEADKEDPTIIQTLKSKADDVCVTLQKIDGARLRYWKYMSTKIHNSTDMN